jgi:translation initiation factor 3 subunit K
MRKFVCHTVNITFQHIELDLLQSFLGDVSPDRLASYARDNNWKIMAKEGKALIHNHEGTVKTRNIEEKLDMSHLRDILRVGC